MDNADPFPLRFARREVQLSSLDEVAQLLEAAGVGDWLRPAVGLPPVAATR